MKLKSIKWTDRGYKVAVFQTEDSENEVTFYMRHAKPEAIALLREIAKAYQEILGIENSMEGFTIRPEGKDKPRQIIFEGEAISNGTGYKIKTYPIDLKIEKLDNFIDTLSDVGNRLMKVNELVDWVSQFQEHLADNFTHYVLTETQQLELFVDGN